MFIICISLQITFGGFKKTKFLGTTVWFNQMLSEVLVCFNADFVLVSIRCAYWHFLVAGTIETIFGYISVFSLSIIVFPMLDGPIHTFCRS